MATTVAVYPREGTTYPDAAGAPITAAGAIVDVSKYIRDAIGAGFLLTFDPLGNYQPDDRTDTGGGSGTGSLSFSQSVALGSSVGSSGLVATTRGALSEGDGGGGHWYWSPGDSTAENIGTCCGASPSGRWLRIHDGEISARWFGAKGNGATTLQSYSYSFSGTPYSFSFTQQTADGVALIKALNYLRNIGGGKLYIPAGTYYVYGCLGQIDFPLEIRGDGIGKTIIKNVSSAPGNTDGYGIFLVQPQSTYTSVGFENLTLDGNGAARTGLLERVTYPLAVYGKTRLRLTNVESRNSPVDCLLIYAENSRNTSVQAVNCRFDSAFRNSVSLSGGWNQQYTNCFFLNGGQVQGGTLPGYCLDIEPDVPSNHMEGLRFSNCHFQTSLNSLAGGVWSEAEFVGCNFVGGDGTADVTMPWLGVFSGGHFAFRSCKFTDLIHYRGNFRIYNATESGYYLGTQYVELDGCHFEGCGIAGYGPSMRVIGCTVMNSAFPVVFTGDSAQSLEVRQLVMTNVVDAYNEGNGSNAAFAVTSYVEGFVIIDGVSIRIDPTKLPVGSDKAKLDLSASATDTAYGIFLQPTLSGIEGRVANVHVSGYYRKYPTAYSHTLDDNKFRDWGTPNLPPADTSGQTAGPGSIYYKSCTMYGNSV